LTLGDAFATVALSLFVLDRTGSGLGVAGVVAAGIVSVLLLRRWPAWSSTGCPPVKVMISADLGVASGGWHRDSIIWQ
jgi:hypothetical protein